MPRIGRCVLRISRRHNNSSQHERDHQMTIEECQLRYLPFLNQLAVHRLRSRSHCLLTPPDKMALNGRFQICNICDGGTYHATKISRIERPIETIQATIVRIRGSFRETGKRSSTKGLQTQVRPSKLRHEPNLTMVDRVMTRKMSCLPTHTDSNPRKFPGAGFR